MEIISPEKKNMTIDKISDIEITGMNMLSTSISIHPIVPYNAVSTIIVCVSLFVGIFGISAPRYARSMKIQL